MRLNYAVSSDSVTRVLGPFTARRLPCLSATQVNRKPGCEHILKHVPQNVFVPMLHIFIAIGRLLFLFKKVLPHQLYRTVGFSSASGLCLSFFLSVYVIGKENLHVGDLENEVNSDALFLLFPCQEVEINN